MKDPSATVWYCDNANHDFIVVKEIDESRADVLRVESTFRVCRKCPLILMKKDR